MDLALFVLAAALVLSALILALVRPETVAREPAASDPRLDTLLSKQGEIGGQFTIAAVVGAALGSDRACRWNWTRRTLVGYRSRG